MAKSKTILVAAHLLTGGTEKGGPASLEGGEELTPKIAKALGLDDDTIAALVDRGALIETEARLAEGSAADNAEALKAAEDRAKKAEADLKAETERADQAEAALAALREEIAAGAGDTGGQGGGRQSAQPAS